MLAEAHAAFIEGTKSGTFIRIRTCNQGLKISLLDNKHADASLLTNFASRPFSALSV